MKSETRNFLRSRLARVTHELRLVQEMRQRVATDPSMDPQRQVIEIRYYDAILRWLLGGAERLEAVISCADGSPWPRT